MTDYPRIPLSPIVQGLVTFQGALAVPVFNGRGVSSVTRALGFPAGAYVLQLDAGLPGNAGAVPSGTTPIANPDVRTLLRPRMLVPPGVPNIVTMAVNYLTSPVPGVGADRILVVMQTNVPPLALADPSGGFEIIVWRTQL